MRPDTDDRNWVTGSRTPDVMFYVGDRIERCKADHADYCERPLEIVPDLVIEVVSPNDTVTELDEKIDSYLADDVRRKAIVYVPDAEQPLHLSENGVLQGGDVLPDFEIALASLFKV